MKTNTTLAVRIDADLAKRLKEEIEWRGLTESTVLLTLLDRATSGFTDFSVLDTIKPRPWGRPRRGIGKEAADQLAELQQSMTVYQIAAALENGKTPEALILDARLEKAQRTRRTPLDAGHDD